MTGVLEGFYFKHRCAVEIMIRFNIEDFVEGTDLKIKITTKQEIHQAYFVFLMNNCNTANRKEVKFCFFLPIGPDEIGHQENNNILGVIFVSFFSCFFNPFPSPI